MGEHAMSLKESDWKAVLDQAKNAGLKAGGGTGISAALRKVADKERNLDNNKSNQTYAELHAALSELIQLCGGVITKHKKLFTTACDYLDKQVRASATRRLSAVETAIEQRDETKKELRRLCTEMLTRFGRPPVPASELKLALAFQRSFGTADNTFPELRALAARVKAFKLPEKKNADFAFRGSSELLAALVALVREAQTAVGAL
jgi:hypothetical protein